MLTDALAEVAEHQAQASAALQELQDSRAQVAVLSRELRASQDLVCPDSTWLLSFFCACSCKDKACVGEMVTRVAETRLQIVSYPAACS